MKFKIAGRENTFYYAEEIEADTEAEAIDIYEEMCGNGEILVSDVRDFSVEIEEIK